MTPSVDSSEPRFQSPEVRRRQILDAAARLAVDEGLDNTSIAKVATAAGLAKGSIYLHFESRQELLSALQADLWDRMLRHPTEVVAATGQTWADKLDMVIEHLMRFEFDHHGLYHAVFHTVSTGSDEPLTQATALLDQLISSGADAGEFRLDGLERAVVLQFLLHGYVGPCFHHADPDTAIHNVQQLFHRCLATVASG